MTAPELSLVPSIAEEEDDPLIGTTLEGRYKIDRILGRGGMGLVYQATHAILQKRLAIKVLKRDVSSDEQVMARFRREAQSASAIGSQHICDVSDFGTMPDGATYFVMEYLDGPSLTDAMKAENPMAVARIIEVGKQLCDALGAAHERGIVHRDLKPDNVHLVKQGSRRDFVKVLDFGIAKVGDGGNKKLTQAGQVFGTPHYMSPEQCSGRDVDHRTDIYALGVMLYEMATGVVPFDADNLMGVLTKHVYENPIPPREFPPPVAVPAGLEAIILKCLSKQPEARYQSMADLKADLDRVAQGATPDAVMEAMSGSVAVPRTQYMSGASHSALEMAPAGAVPPTSRAGLIVAGIFGTLFLGGAAFAGAFFFAGGAEPEADSTLVAETVTDELATDPSTETPADPDQVPTPETQVTPPPPVAEVVPPHRAMVRITTEPEHAEIAAADGTLIGNAPIDLERPEGDERTELIIRAPEHEDRSLVLSRLTQSEVNVRLIRERRSRPVAVRQPPPVIHQPPPRPLAPVAPPPRPRRPGVGSEIISPW